MMCSRRNQTTIPITTDSETARRMPARPIFFASCMLPPPMAWATRVLVALAMDRGSM